jgi:GTP-binding protein Era
MHKAGFVNIIGNPNVGKSTLMNALVGEQLATITHKAQTTRHRIMGIVNGPDFQVVYSDTPGIVNPAYQLHQKMLGYIKTAIDDADVILYLVETGEKTIKNEDIINKINQLKIPILLLINKIDLGNEEKVIETAQFWQAQIPKAEIKAISALHGFNVDKVLPRIVELLPENPKYYPDDQLTDRYERFFAAEIIREKLLLLYNKEIPYSCEVGIESYKEDDEIIRINALIFTERDSQKGILIGKEGKSMKKLGIESRKDLEKFFQKHIHLELKVKVLKDWRNNENLLKKFGYIQ